MSSKSVNSYFKILIGAFLLVAITSPVSAQSDLSVEQRLNRLENLLANQVLMEQSQRMEQIQQELASLRELVENQEHQLGMIQQRQRNLYQDMDRRLQEVEIKGGSGSSSNNVVVPMAIQSPTSPVPPPSAGAAATSKSTVSSQIASPVPGDKTGKQAYSSAFKTLKQGKYKQAIAEFKAFQIAYPDSAYSANVHYWLGRAYSLSRDYKSALDEFNIVVNKYPDSNKAEDAMLGTGFTYYEMQDWASAKTALNAVISKYPGSTGARKSKERLQRIAREGH